MKHTVNSLILLFDQLFKNSEQTILVGGANEPLYLPNNEQCEFHQIIFTHDYFASALHEIAHWCLAGKKRRQLVDYGYWYQPDGRTPQQQMAFEQVELKPQALEWIFAEAAGSKFNISSDNLTGVTTNTDHFKIKLQQQVIDFLQNGLPERAAIFKQALLNFYQRESLFSVELFM